MNTKTITLEPSTNTHTMTNVIECEYITESTLKLKVAEKANVYHGEHGTIAVESQNVIKYVQQELNPITKKLQNAWD